MRTHTNDFKNQIATFGREIENKITYIENSETIELTSKDLYSVTPNITSELLKSVMKQLTIESKTLIAKDTEINYKFGLKVGNSYEYIDFGNYIVYSVEKQEDTNSYKMICYDKMLYAMKDYEDMNITYPITVRNYINAICQHLGLTFKNASDVFPNYNRIIQNELYLNTEGYSLGYTFRAVLDELSQVVAGNICINESDDELEIRYINNTSDKLPSNYTEVEYIQSTGTQFINLPFGFERTDIIDIDVSIDSGQFSDNYMIASRTWNSNNNRFAMGGFVNSKFTCGFGSKTTQQTILSPETNYDSNRHQWHYENSTFSITDLNLTYNGRNDTFGGITTDLKLFYGYNSNSKGKIYKYTHWKNNTKIIELIPCYRKSDNVVGMYDLVNGVFYTNSGTGTFLKGNDIYDEINERFLQDINVNFGEKYGPVNSIVLSRADESDSVYLRDEQSVTQNGLCEIKIKDNQIMNLNDRADYLQDILNTLDGLEYYVNDFVSTGITYYELCDKYNIRIGENIYPCIMFNDEVLVTQGLQENIHTERLEEGVTEYKYASKDDRQSTQTYIIAKKNEAEIEALTEKVIDISGETNWSTSAVLENAYEGTLHRLEVKGRINYLYPSNDLVPSNDITPRDSYIVVYSDGESTKYKVDIPILTYIDEEHYDKFIYEDGKCWVERINGTIEEKEDVVIYVKSNSVLYVLPLVEPVIQIKAIYLLQNEYTDTFANDLDLVSKINLTPGKAVISANKVSLEGKEINLTSDNINITSKNFKVDKDGNLECNNAKITGGIIDIYGNENNSRMKITNPNNITQYSEYSSGTIKFYNNEVLRTVLMGVSGMISFYDSSNFHSILASSILYFRQPYSDTNIIELNASTGNIRCVSLTQTSKEEEKKNFEKLESGLKIIDSIDIYKYNLKNENDDDKKHIGFVIGDKFNYSKEVTSKENNEVDIYSFISVCCQAIKELQKEVKELRERIDK